MKKRQINITFDMQKGIWTLFIVYLLCLIVFVAFHFRGSLAVMMHERGYIEWQRSMGVSNFIFAPFMTISANLSHIGDQSYQLALLGNVFCYLPIGIFVPTLLSSRYKLLTRIGIVFCASLAIILAVECIQYFSMFGVFNFDDIILGMIGVFLGFAIYNIGKSVVKAISSNNT